MKYYVNPVLIIMLGLFFSCTSDNVESNAITTQQAAQLESVQLQADDVSTEAIIAGASKVQGNLPTPNGAITLDVSNSSTTAFLGEGFDINFNSDGNPVGAYLQYGVAASDYFDINIAANASGKGRKASGLSFNGNIPSSITRKNTDAEIDVDFGVDLPPGQFCYTICVYDEQGNISEPEQVCVTVESWGGMDEMDGAWVMVREERNEDGQTVTFETGMEACYQYSFECNDGQAISASECYTRTLGEVQINSDGTYRALFNGLERWLDGGLSSENCEAVYVEESFEDISEGRWAFVTESNRLTIVEYYFRGIINGELDEEFTLDTGDARLVLDGTIELVGNSFLITESQDDDQDGIEEIRRYYFERQ